VPVEIAVQFQIPMSRGERYNSGLVFKRWLPLNQDNTILANKNGVTVRLWIDQSCLIPNSVPLREINSYVTIFVTHVITEVVTTVSRELADFIYTERDVLEHFPSTEFSDETKATLAREYAEVARQVLSAAVESVNRLILYVRNHKGQYWLEPLDMPIADVDVHSANVGFRARVRIPPQDWFRWSPPGAFVLRAGASQPERYIAEEDWSDLRSFVTGSSRPELVLELLANAESLADAGRQRSALIEAATALELALSNFARAPLIGALQDMVNSRVHVKSLKNQVEHLGFLGSLKYLIPLLFTERVLAKKTLEQCWAAVDMRQVVVHGSRRDVPEDRLAVFLSAIRIACRVLRDSTNTKREHKAVK